MTPADVVKLIKEKEATYCDLRFTDTRGKEQHVTIPARMVDEDFSFTILPRDFLESEGEVTPSQKLKRKVIEQRYKAELDAMYREPVA